MVRKRIARLNEQLKRELTAIIQFELRDPRVGPVTITDVEVAPDLYHAKVFFSASGDDDEKQRAREGLRAAAGFLRTELGRRLHIRRAPELHFTLDSTLEHAMHIERLLRQVRSEEHAATADDGPEEPTADGDDADDES
jgi:ribosome-binding factor A